MNVIMSGSEFDNEYATQPMRFIESERFVDVSFPYEHQVTIERMPFEERSYSLELLEKAVPLENRIEHLIPYVEPTAELLSARMIAEEIGADVAWVIRIAERIGIKTITTQNHNLSTSELYPSFSKELLEEEWGWYRAYSELEDWVSVGEIEEFIVKGRKWVIWRANELGIFLESRIVSSKRMAMAYPKTLIPQLRHIILSVPKIENHFTVNQLASYYDQDWEWVQRRLREAGLKPKILDSVSYGAFLEFYPEESDEVIRKAIAERPPHAGDWLTETAMEMRLGKDIKWVRAHINTALGKTLQDDTGKNATHYPASESVRLKVLVDEIHSYPIVVDELAVKSIANLIGRSERWTRDRLPLTQFPPRVLRNHQDKLHTYYDEGVTEALVALPDDILTFVHTNVPHTMESIVSILNEKVAPDTKITVELIRQLKREDPSVPSITSVQKYFGSISKLNEYRNVYRLQ